MEIWKDVCGYEGIYQVSSNGAVKSLPRKVWNYIKPGRVLQQHNNGHGYCYLSLCADGIKAKHAYVHIIVAQAFIENPNGYTQVNHKDFNKSNNSVDNLEWVSPSQNKTHYRQSAYCKAVENGRQGTNRSKWVYRVLQHKKQVISLYECGESIKNIANIMHIGRDFVSDILRIYEYIK